MNLNSSNSQDIDLRQAVQDQLDLILKIEEERKVLKRQNKLLQQKLKQLGSRMQKYQRQTISTETNTETVSSLQQEHQKDKPNEKQNKNTLNIEVQEFGVQINLDAVNNSVIMNCSKLTEARSLLKVLDQYESKNQNIEANGEARKNLRANSKKQKSGEKQKTSKEQHGPDKQLASQMMKITKQLNLTKKQLKEMQHKYKLREKEIKDLKKCLDNKNEALQKSRKQFNQLSIVMNSDRYKSVRNLEQQIHTLKSKLLIQEDNSKMKQILGEVTQEYEDYRKSTENKIDILVSELASKQKQIANLENIRKSSKSGV